MTTKKIRKLNRFTTLPVLLDLLERRKLTLLDPKLWDDRNDSEVILSYKRKKGVKNLFAVCLSHGDETVHHWKTFSDGTSGCVIEFDAEKLFDIINKIPGLRHDKISYKKLLEIEKKDAVIDIEDMPFTKRWPYRCEEEYRIIVENSSDETFFEIDITLDIIKRITISQHMPQPIYATIKNYLNALGKDASSKISRSTLYENKRWINRFQK
ncbi:hypothetical protein [Pedobacter hartonius]|uniref:DUF2971 domain-containing protein n=1 Tax=Pedobacter hartonius TaxID=425514 RepID=A0A1H4HI95_9SPHI|nr:hypothetical protein [Pedobacter hartonius]SEB21544.1 hypothetical protein SAMN05443550_12019 [Pedobacter hartonius]